MQPHEGSFTDDLRSTIKNIAADNAEYLTRLEEGDVQPAVVRKLVAMTMRIVNSLIRSIQLDINSRRLVALLMFQFLLVFLQNL